MTHDTKDLINVQQIAMQMLIMIRFIMAMDAEHAIDL